MAKKDVKKEEKEKKDKKDKKVKKIKKTKKKTKEKKESFFEGVRNEISKVKWPTRKDVIKYTIATLVFIVFLATFFVLLSLVMSLVKGAFN